MGSPAGRDTARHAQGSPATAPGASPTAPRASGSTAAFHPPLNPLGLLSPKCIIPPFLRCLIFFLRGRSAGCVPVLWDLAAIGVMSCAAGQVSAPAPPPPVAVPAVCSMAVPHCRETEPRVERPQRNPPRGGTWGQATPLHLPPAKLGS